jgi:hypothetical protein
MAIRLSTLAALHTPGCFLILISLRGGVDPRAIVWLEELVQLKYPIISSGFETPTFQLVA